MAATDIVVTEIMYDPTQSGVQQDKLYEWVEIQNTGASAVDMSGWTLDDSRTTTNDSYGTFPNITLQPGEIAIFYNGNLTQQQFQDEFPNMPASTVLIPVTNWQQLNNGSSGDTVNLIDNTGASVVSLTYTDLANAGETLNFPPAGVPSVGVPDPGVTCFTAGSLIETQAGPCRIEDLQVGAQVRTLDHGLQTLRWVGRRVVSGAEQRQHPELCPIEIDAGALGPQTPTRRTRVSPQHRLLVANAMMAALFDQPRMLCAAHALVGQAGVRQLPPGAAVEYVHVLFDQHEVVFVDGHASESFYPNEAALSALSPLARTELFALFPDIESAALSVVYPVMSQAEAALLNL